MWLAGAGRWRPVRACAYSDCEATLTDRASAADAGRGGRAALERVWSAAHFVSPADCSAYHLRIGAERWSARRSVSESPGERHCAEPGAAWLDGHRDVMQRYVDSYVQATAREKQNEALVAQVLQTTSNVTSADQVDVLYRAYVLNGEPSLPYPRMEQYTDTLAELATQNPQASSLDLSGILDSSFVQSAADRGLDRS